MDASFTTRVTIQPLNEPMGYPDNWMSLGSCFAENIGHKLHNAGFRTLTNPFGVLFNPLSIANSLHRIISNHTFDQSELFQYGSLWNHFQFSNLYSGIDQASTLQAMNKQLEQAVVFFNTTNVLMLTFGTAWIYESKANEEVVANCHKLPADRFIRRRLSVAEIVDTYSNLIRKLPESMRIVLTVSPVRHWKDGAHENIISKSTLHLAVSEICELFSSRVFYFPAYELIIDELRDYRFFKEDMVHPSDQAVDYVWQTFNEWGFSATTRSIVTAVEEYRKMEKHRSIHPNSDEHLAFITKTRDYRNKLVKQYPYLVL